MTLDRVRYLLDLDETTGIFRWRVATSNMKAGTVAGCIDPNGYTFDTADLAARAYDAAAVALYGEFARLNFPAEGCR